MEALEIIPDFFQSARVGSIKSLQFFIEGQNFDVNLLDEYHSSAFLLACRYGHLEAAKYLLSKDADPNISDIKDHNARYYAVNKKYSELDEFLKEQFELPAKLTNENILSIIQLGKVDEFNKYLNENESAINEIIDGDTLLIHAIEHNQYDIAKILIERGADVDMKGEKETPLTLAAMKGNIEIAKLLLDNYANIEKRNCYNNSPLQVACRQSNIEMAKFLLDAGGANVNCQYNKKNLPPILQAAKRDNLELVKLLVEEYKANVSPNVEKEKLEEFYEKAPKCVSYLKSKKSKLF